MNSHIQREEAVHGDAWHSVHGGYFSDQAVAAPLLEKARSLAVESGAKRIIDLGGGNGFILGRLKADGIGAALLNLESSEPQLAAARRAGIPCARGSVATFTRCEVNPGESRSLFIMRSVLHYFGEDSLRPVVRHIHAQVGQGEFWLHQTASFENAADADCLNTLYSMIRTTKWYPTVTFMRQCLNDEGWQVREILPCPPLPLTSAALAARYGLSAADIGDIRKRLGTGVPVPDTVFQRTDDGFCAYLHYWLYVCTPAR